MTFMMGSNVEIIYHALTLGVIASAMRLAWVDIRKLEIELETLIAMLVLGFLQSWMVVDIFETGIRVFSGLSFWLILSFGNSKVPGMGRFGAGDPPLIGVIAFLVAPMILPWAILAALFMLMTCAYYSAIRGKKLFWSMFPAAPPLLAAGVLVYLLQWG